MKILQWLFGSFFRTIGRTIAILVMGGLLYYILSINGIGISDLFLDNVKADSLNTFNVGSWAGWPTDPILTEYSRARIDNPTYINGSNFNPTNTLSNITGINKIQITGYFQDLTFSDNIELDRFYCSSSNNGVCNEYVFQPGGVQLFTFQVWTNNHITQCQMEWNSIQIGQSDFNNKLFWTATCNASALNNISLYIDFQNSYFGSDYHPYIAINKNVKYWKSDSSSIIENQNQNTQSIIQQQQNATNQILDDNTTQADNTGKDFITNFNNNTHGLTGIITAPLNAIQSLSSATCSPLILPLPFTNNKTLTLPCMSIVYSQYFGAFYTMYQGIILGLISYWVCVRIFALAKGFKDPEDDKIEVVDL